MPATDWRLVMYVNLGKGCYVMVAPTPCSQVYLRLQPDLQPFTANQRQRSLRLIVAGHVWSAFCKLQQRGLTLFGNVYCSGSGDSVRLCVVAVFM